MPSECIVTQVHIPDFDPQGSLNIEQKRSLVDLSLLHLRQFNPAAYIILSGHGHSPSQKALDVCDFVYWEDQCRAVGGDGYVIGMPGQYVFVSRGIQHAIDKGFKRCLKTRTDCVIGIPHIIARCESIVQGEGKQMILTQQTGDQRAGDCFMYGGTKDLHAVWHENNPVTSLDGLLNIGQRYADHYKYGGEPWADFMKNKVKTAFRDVVDLQFMCLRWNYHTLCQYYGTWEAAADKILNDPRFPYNSYHWGKANNWHQFDTEGNMTVRYSPAFWSRKEFYSDN